MHNELESDFMPIVTATICLKFIAVWLCCQKLQSRWSAELLNFFLAADHDLCPSPINRQV